MYFLLAIPAVALLVILAAWFYDLTKGFRQKRSGFLAGVRYGILNFTAFGKLFQLKMPWCIPLFSERYGYRTPYAKIGMLRLFIEKNVVPSDILADALIQHMLESDRSH